MIARISPNGAVITNPWVTLPAGVGEHFRGSLFQDRYCVLGGDLIAVTTFGEVWRVTSLGVATHVASLGTHLEGVTTVPNSPATYGPWAGKILIGAEAAGAGTGRLYTVDLGGVVTEYNLGIKPEDIDIVPPNENFYGVSFSGLTTRLVGAPAVEFADKVGNIVITTESPGKM